MSLFNRREVEIIRELQSQIKNLQAELKEKDGKISQLAFENQKNSGNLGNQNLKIQDLENQNQTLKAENQNLENQLQFITNQLQFVTKENRKDVKRFENREARYEEIIAEAEKVVIDLEARVYGLQLALDKKTDISAYELQLKNLEEEIEDREELLEELDDEIKDRKICIVEIEAEILDLKETRDTLADEVAIEKQRIAEEMKQLAESFEEEKDMMLVSNVFNNPYNYETSDEYQAKLDEIKDEQKRMVKDEEAIVCTTSWHVNNSKVEGKKFTKKIAQLMLRAFVNEADNIIMKARYTYMDKAKADMEKSYNAVNKLSSIVDSSISEEFFNLKLEELTLRFGWLEKKEEEKEELRRQQEILKEQAKAEEEMKAKMVQLNVEREHFNNELARLSELEQTDEVLTQIQSAQEMLEELDKQEEEIENRMINNKAGYVYVISSPSFEGQEIYKIGVTRRLDPQVRVDELGSASLPFRFGVHSFIFSEDAFALEHSLHTAFDSQRVNKANVRKEFFHVTLEEIKEEVKKHNPTAQFIDEVVVEEYELTKKMEEME